MATRGVTPAAASASYVPARRRSLFPQHERPVGEIQRSHLGSDERVVGGDHHDQLVLPDDGTD
jgi:hypothetical protein